MSSRVLLRALAGAVCGAIAAPALAAPSAEASGPSWARMERLVSLRARSATVREALAALEAASGLELDPAWIDERHTEGLDPERTIELDGKARPAIRTLELILQRADPTATWQWQGESVQVGPRARLNDYRTVRIYPVHDLLTIVPEYVEAPTIDLQAALQPRSASPLREPGTARKEPEAKEASPADQLIDLITSTIEPEQWLSGSGATVRVYHEALIVNAPGYIHRQLIGRLGD